MLSTEPRAPPPSALPSLLTRSAAAVRDGLVAVLMAAALYPAGVEPGLRLAAEELADARRTYASAPFHVARRADFGGLPPSADVEAVADWVAGAQDNGGMAFVIVDKKAAQLYVFNAVAQLMARSPVLLGSALGDESVPGIGDRPIDEVRPEERTTPAGRFLGERGRNARGEDVVWLDYDAAVSMHRVVTANAAERRPERLLTPTADDNRISYGCINVPVVFYESYLRPAFAQRQAVIYVLPDSGALQQFFGMQRGNKVAPVVI